MNKFFTKLFQLLFIFLLAISCMAISSCTKTQNLQIACSVASVKADAAVIHSTLNPVKQGIGIQLTILINDSVVDRINRMHNGNTDFNVPNLKPNTNYKVEMNVINDPTIKAEPCSISFTTLLSNTPLVNTSSFSNVTSSGADVSGDVVYSGLSPVTERGICWSLSPNPGNGSYRVVAGSGLGAFTATLHGFSADTKYHVRAYAVNSAGWGYGADISFTTAP